MNIIECRPTDASNGPLFIIISCVCGCERNKKNGTQISFSRLTRIDFLPFQFDNNTRQSRPQAVDTHTHTQYVRTLSRAPYLMGFLRLYVYLDGCVQQSDTCFYRLCSSHFTFFDFLLLLLPADERVYHWSDLHTKLYRCCSDPFTCNLFEHINILSMRYV